MAKNQKLKPDKDGRVKLTKTRAQYTLAEWTALTVNERLEILARELKLLK